ncbi:hypothetical protein CUJ83_14880 [Methanocella sp. CWC-04]|uniref:Uncharacterized protein n=1 Tax=Methanooceanicella nereidis TaxID=2052831 RepID=A0AAP2RGN0_9EURY|nr:hypothetical protein [Methanocella sp. CWC-04]MCD1296285.1 hypothetical protein [Methanocella sp. CWC-04]
MSLKEDDSARVPFAIIGIIMIIMSAAISAYLMKMESQEISRAQLDEKDAMLNDAISFAVADIDLALNYAGMYAESEIGLRPVANRSASSPLYGSPDKVNMDRIKYLTHKRLSDHLKSNYGKNSFVYGDYAIEAYLTGGYSSLNIEPVNMSMERIVDSPVIKCDEEYAAYYIISAPVRINIKEQGSDLCHIEDHTARALITSRYPLMKQLCEEYEKRLAGDAFFIDMTGASFAYTLARGYSQYVTTEPMNIVDNSHLELIVNGASLLEQGFVFNSVDPLSLASLTVETAESVSKTPQDRYGHVNQYNFSKNSMDSVQNYGEDTEYSREYGFNADRIIDSAFVNALKGPGIRNTIDSAYTCEMHIEIKRDTKGNTSSPYVKELLDRSLYPDTELPVLAMEKWSVSDSGKNEIVTLEYVADDYRLAQYGGDVCSPFISGSYSGRKDVNMEASVDSYKEAIGFGSKIDNILSDKGLYPDGSSAFKRSFSVKRDMWVECAAKDELYELSGQLKKDVSVTIRSDGYASPQEMLAEASTKMEKEFNARYGQYLLKEKYTEGDLFKTCGAKSLFNIRRSFLEDIKAGLNDSSASSASSLESSIDSEMGKYTGSMNSSSLSRNAGVSKNFLTNNLYIPFGLAMNLSSDNSMDGNYSWSEKVTIAVNQKPDYLCTVPYVDPATGYASYPLKVRNICIFTIPCDPDSVAGTGNAILDGIDSVLEASGDVSNDTVSVNSREVASRVSIDAVLMMKEEIGAALLTDMEMCGAVSERDIDNAVEDSIKGLTSSEIIKGLKNGIIQQDIARSLSDRACEEIRKRAGAEKEYCDYIREKTRIVVLDACDRAVSYALSENGSAIENNFKDFIAAGERSIEKESVKAALRSIPMGMPLLPPYGYWATLNVWYIEVDGEIPVFTVYDADCEPVPDPLFGHEAVSYTRQRDLGIDDGYGILGYNEPIRFHTETSTFILVPPGKAGAGDRIGGWDEKSPGYISAG